MHTNWQNYLSSLSPLAVTPENLQLHQQDTLLIDLADTALIKASGSEWRSFLQGQLSSDLQQLSTQMSQLSSYNSPKGRIMAVFRLIEAHDGVWLQLPREIQQSIQKRLSMFIMRADVTLANESDEWVCFGVCGPQARELLQPWVSHIPEQQGECVTSKDVTITLETHSANPCYQIITTPTQAVSMWKQLSEKAVCMEQEAWDLQLIGAGIPNVYAVTQETWVAQMINLQLTGGVSFTKGCFTGQEVIARMQHLGTLKRQMYRAHIKTADRPEIGASLVSEHSKSGQGAGRIVRVAPSPQGGYEVLAVMEISAAEASPLTLEEDPTATLELLSLPYAFAS
jgi:tRNA-modifying protein YgfZ